MFKPNHWVGFAIILAVVLLLSREKLQTPYFSELHTIILALVGAGGIIAFIVFLFLKFKRPPGETSEHEPVPINPIVKLILLSLVILAFVTILSSQYANASAPYDLDAYLAERGIKEHWSDIPMLIFLFASSIGGLWAVINSTKPVCTNQQSQSLGILPKCLIAVAFVGAALAATVVGLAFLSMGGAI